jgi:hypothetical protein
VYTSNKIFANEAICTQQIACLSEEILQQFCSDEDVDSLISFELIPKDNYLDLD